MKWERSTVFDEFTNFCVYFIIILNYFGMSSVSKNYVWNKNNYIQLTIIKLYISEFSIVLFNKNTHEIKIIIA